MAKANEKLVELTTAKPVGITVQVTIQGKAAGDPDRYVSQTVYSTNPAITAAEAMNTIIQPLQ